MNRRQNFQTIAWFKDLYKKRFIKLKPSISKKKRMDTVFKDYFIDTLLLQYPAPTISCMKKYQTMELLNTMLLMVNNA
ncbi:MAG: hypothetical protein IPO33_12170 [Saprospiraceae bacterium]|nr:hypothetical protein [Candidatus Brachybacter algidus]